MDETFNTWLEQEIEKRGWSLSELGRRAGLSHATVSYVLSGKNKPGPDLCNGIAQAFGESVVKVFRLAGLLPALDEDTFDREKFLDVLNYLTPEERDDVIAYAKFRHEYNQRQQPAQDDAAV